MGDRRRRRMYLIKIVRVSQVTSTFINLTKLREETMRTKSYVTIRDLPEHCHSFKKLPEHIHHKHIAISDSKAVNNGEFFYFYHDSSQKLCLRYFSYNHYPEEYWRMVGIGELIACSSKDFIKQLNSLYKGDKLFYPVVTPVHHNPDNYYRNQVRYFPLPPLSQSEKDKFLGDSSIKYIFVPTDSFINSHKDADEVFDQLKGYFREYSDFDNDENYIVQTDMYDLSSDANFIEPVDGMDGIQIIGYEKAKQVLCEFDINEFLEDLSLVRSKLNC